MHVSIRRRGGRLLRAHTRLRVGTPRLYEEGGERRVDADLMEHITWVYQDGPDFGVEARVVVHHQRWQLSGGRWRLLAAREEDERTAGHPRGGHPRGGDVRDGHVRGGEPGGEGPRTAASADPVWTDVRSWFPGWMRACTRYDRVQALRFADLWWNGHHPAFVKLEDDCTNFISQCLFNGRMPMKTSGSRAVGWWYRFPSGGRDADWSFSWTTAHALYTHLMTHMGAREVSDPQELRIGDLVFYDWSGNGRFHHSTIVTDFDRRGDPLVNAHTTASFRRHYRYLDSRAWTPRTRYAFVRLPDEFCPEM
ncbi:MAG: amidase domain-containing protein [Alicyclobacillus sp.]|nr:amidase domain-containing protein [Alicyclobacillus sp.]